MIRRCVSLLVILGMLASQLVAIPHAHAGHSAADQQKHDATPHFHTGPHRHGDHEHAPANGGHGHDDHGPSTESASESQPRDPSNDLPPVPSGGSGHDADAVFVPASSGPLSSSTSHESAESTSQLAADVPPIGSHGGAWPLLRSAPMWHPPDAVQDGSDTYLTLRNLRL